MADEKKNKDTGLGNDAALAKQIAEQMQRINESLEERAKKLEKTIDLEEQVSKHLTDGEKREQQRLHIAQLRIEHANTQIELEKQALATAKELGTLDEETINLKLKSIESLERYRDINQEILDQDREHKQAVEEWGRAAESAVSSFTEKLLGFNKNISKNSFLGQLSRGIEAKGLTGALSDIGKELKQTFTMANIATATFQKFQESTIKVAIEENNALTSFKKATGAGDKYDDTILELSRGHRSLDIDVDKASKSIEALRQNYVDFNLQSMSTQKDLALLTSKFEGLGISSEISSKAIAFSMKTLGMSATRAKTVQKELVATARVLGVAPSKMAQDFLEASPKIAQFGDKATDVFKKLAVQAKATGIETNRLLDITEQFETFEGAAEGVSKLNNILGGPYLDSLQLLEAEGPEKITLLKDSIDKAGVSYENMNRWQKKAIASALNMSVPEVANMMAGKLNAQADAAEAAAIREEELNKLIQDAIPLGQKMVNMIKSIALAVQPVVEKMGWFIDEITKLPSAIKVVIGVSAGLVGVLGIIGTAFKVFALKSVAAAAIQATGMAGAASTAGAGISAGITSIGAASLASAPGILILAGAIALIGIGIGIAAYGIAKMVSSFSDLFKNLSGMVGIIPNLVSGLWSLAKPLALSSWRAFKFSAAMKDLSDSLEDLSSSLSLVKTRDLEILNSIFYNISRITDATANSIRSVSSSIKEMMASIGSVPVFSLFTFAMAMDSLSVSLPAIPKIETETVENVKKIVEQSKNYMEIREKSRVISPDPFVKMLETSKAVSTGTSRSVEKQPVILHVNDRVLGQFVLDVVNRENSPRKDR